jgi:hypothetical protein
MKQVLFIEDRPKRQVQFLPNGEDDLKKIKEIKGVDLKKEEECKEIFESVNNGDTNEIEGYDLLLFHRSALKQKGLNTLREYCKENYTPLILFSGGVSQFNFQNEEFPFLILNSKDFYSPRLIEFLENFVNDQVENIPELLGDNWKLSFLMKYRNLLFIDEEKGEREEEIDRLKEFLGDKSVKDLNTEIREQILKL